MAQRRWGTGILADQTLYHERSDGRRGLSLFGVYTISDRTTAQILRCYEAGGVYQGTFSGRANDTVSPGYVRAVVNPHLIQSAKNSNPSTGGLPPAESVIELSYGAQITKWLLIRPDLQYILDPGAFRFARERRALPFGVQVKVQF